MRKVLFFTLAVAMATGAAHAQSGKYGALVATAKQQVAKDFKDPDSAKFRDLGIYKSTTGKGGVSVCGEVNAKNSYGAYVGFQKFTFWDGDAQVDDNDPDGLFAMVHPNLCYELVTKSK